MTPMHGYRVCIIALFIGAAIQLQARGRYSSAWDACTAALAQLKLDTVSANRDSISVRLITADSAAGKICVYDLRVNTHKTISIIYWAEGARREKKRLFGLMSPKILYEPVFQVGLLSPYDKVDNIVTSLPDYHHVPQADCPAICTSSFIRIRETYFRTACLDDDCAWEEQLQDFFDKHFFYSKE